MKLKHEQTGATHLVVILLIILIATVGVVGWKVWDTGRDKDSSTNTTKNTVTKSNPSSSETQYATIDDWGVRFPLTHVGKYAYHLPKTGLGSTPESSTGGPSDMQYVYVNVSGFSSEEYKCTFENNGDVLGLGSIYRHKEQNPTIQYESTFQLNPAAQVKIDDWYYSTTGLGGNSGNCFEGKTLSVDYVKLQSTYLENFKKLAKF